jgi:hypothetical protein
MAAAHIRKLETLQKQKKTLQEKIDKTKSEALAEISTYLVDANALDIDLSILMGGMLYVIDKSNQGDKITEAWKESGQKFCQQVRKKNTQKNIDAPKKAKKIKNDDQ